MARFVVSHRLSGTVDRKASREAVGELEPTLSRFASEVRVVGRGTPDSRLTFTLDADPREMDQRRRGWSRDVLVEPEVERRSLARRRGHAADGGSGPTDGEFSGAGVALRNSFAEARPWSLPTSAGVGESLTVMLRGEGKPVAGARATLMLSSVFGQAASTAIPGTSDAEGKVVFPYGAWMWRPLGLLIEPVEGYWSVIQSYPRDGMTLDLPPLGRSGPLGWWHYVVGESRNQANQGEGIRIGVADSGVGPNPYLDHVRRIGSFMGGVHDPSPDAALDASDHGTHVCGVLAARPTDGSGDYAGLARDAEVMVLRIFGPDLQANQGDIAGAIEILAGLHQADLINLSLGGPEFSSIELDAVIAAMEQGALCVCAAGNDYGQPVLYPAANPQTVAVTALGLLGTTPPNTLAAGSVPTQPTKYTPGGLYVANFSDSGPQVDCSAPGVGIISTVPARTSGVAAPYADKSGTSVATPVACASLATLLSQDAVYRSLPRGSERAQRALAVLRWSLRPTGLSQYDAGWGMSQAWPR